MTESVYKFFYKKLYIFSEKSAELFFVFFFSSCVSCTQAESRDRLLDQTVESYFKVWSKGDMEGYSSIFHKSAVIQYKSRTGQMITEQLSDFIAGQRNAHRLNPGKMNEIPLEKRYHQNGDTAQVQVRWKLSTPNMTATGWDHFTFIRTGGDWKIIYLYFYSDE